MCPWSCVCVCVGRKNKRTPIRQRTVEGDGALRGNETALPGTVVIDSVCPFRNVMFYRCGFFQFDTKWRRLLDAGVDQYSTRNEHHINSKRWTSAPSLSLSSSTSMAVVVVVWRGSARSAETKSPHAHINTQTRIQL